MPYNVVEFQETPNPHAMKCVLDRAIAESPRSYFSREQAAADPGVVELVLDPWPRRMRRPQP